jgi:hypothetical protein
MCLIGLVTKRLETAGAMPCVVSCRVVSCRVATERRPRTVGGSAFVPPVSAALDSAVPHLTRVSLLISSDSHILLCTSYYSLETAYTAFRSDFLVHYIRYSTTQLANTISTKLNLTADPNF